MKMDLAVARYEIAKISIFIENIKIIISGKNGDDGTELIINEGNGYIFQMDLFSKKYTLNPLYRWISKFSP